MIATRGTARRAVLSFAQQVSLSVLGTLAATAVLAALQSEWSVRPAAPEAVTAHISALPSLTEGGKFAARAVGGDEPDAFVTLTRLPLILPLFTAPAVPQLDLDMSDSAPPPTALVVPETIAPAAAPIRPAPHREARHSIGTARPPHHDAAQTIAMAPLPEPPTAGPEDASFWARSKSAYQRVASWGGTMVDTLLP